MDEATAVWRARQLVRKVRPEAVPVRVEQYATEIGAEVRVEALEPDEAGCSFEAGGKRFICVNAADRRTRQRFTICHEIAHFVLKLPSEHTNSPAWSYTRRPLSEIWCDVFAAELLLPIDLFKSRVARSEMSLEAVSALAEEFDASFPATGSRFAAVAENPCAFVLAEGGIVRYASRSKALRDPVLFTDRRLLRGERLISSLRPPTSLRGPSRTRPSSFPRASARTERARRTPSDTPLPRWPEVRRRQ